MFHYRWNLPNTLLLPEIRDKIASYTAELWRFHFYCDFDELDTTVARSIDFTGFLRWEKSSMKDTRLNLSAMPDEKIFYVYLYLTWLPAYEYFQTLMFELIPRNDAMQNGIEYLCDLQWNYLINRRGRIVECLFQLARVAKRFLVIGN